MSQFNDVDQKANNTNKFLYIVDGFFSDAYNVFVKDMKVETLDEDEMVKVVIPVEYSLKMELFETLFADLIHAKKINENGTLTIKLLKDNFYIEESLENYFSLMKYQIVPVMFFLNQKEEVKHVHIDSWEENYDFFPVQLNKNFDLTITNTFKPLFSITPGEDDIQLNFDSANQTLDYEFLFSIQDFQEYDYSKLSIQFYYENDLEESINSLANIR